MVSQWRPNICIAIKKRGTDRLLLCHRKGCSGASGWQFPQGGIDKRRDLLEEMKRELREEIGTDSVGVIAISPHRYRYRFPKEFAASHPEYKGQTQQWVLVEFGEDDSKINFTHLPAEFDAFQWVDAAQVIEKIVDFKKNVYHKAMRDLEILI